MPPHRRLVGASLIAAGVIGIAVAVLERWGRISEIGLAIAAAVPVMVELLTAGIGVWLVYLYWPRRQGWGLHCKRCGYHQERQGRLAPACPECGAAWLWIGMTRYGRPSGVPAMVVLGVVLCLLAGVGAMMHRAAPWVYLRLLPDRVILEQLAVLPEDATADLWSELQRRSLPQASLDALARPLLSKKARDGYLSPVAEGVVFDAVMRAGAPADLSAKYFASFLTAQVETPESVQEGRGIALKSVAVFRGRPPTTGTLPRVIVLSALYRGRETEPIKMWEWEPDASPSQERPMDFTFEGTEPGVVSLRQAFWLAVGPPGVERVMWIDGQPTLPVTMSFKDRFEESREVRVEPKKKPSTQLPR